MKTGITILLVILLSAFSGFAQQVDTTAVAAGDTVTMSIAPADFGATEQYLKLAAYTSPFLNTAGKPVVYDIQQYQPPRVNAIVFAVLVLMLVIIAYLRTAFSNELEDMLQSFANRNIAQQIFRTQTSELTFSSFLLHVNFILVISLYIRFALVKFFQVSSLESFTSILFLIFLFTFFYGAKTLTTNLIGVVFEMKEVTDEYLFNFFTVCKTLGLTLIPALFVFYTAPDKYFKLIFIITLILVAVFTLLFIWRGLSTGYKLLYKSVYHFFIYVCVVEISPIFLLFKLLTKTVV